jgi:hypothetical protein
MLLPESFLHYLWQYQYFARSALRTTEGEDLVVFHPGLHNTDAGPDFSQARIRIGSIDWTGNVEIHYRSGEWRTHRHDQDPSYDNVILHVVWQDDEPVFARDKSRVPTLELKDRVETEIINRYKKVVLQPEDIPCRRSFGAVSDVVKISMLDRALMSRLERKSEPLRADLASTRGDWEEVAYRALARNFGFKVNQEAFGELGRVLPYRIVQKHLSHPLQAEALAYGMAGFLDKEVKDEYFVSLRKEFSFLRSKYGLEAAGLKRSQWKFLRLRPGNFPSIRIAQWVSLLAAGPSLLSKFLNAESVKDMRAFLQTPPSDYWKTHYNFGKSSDITGHTLGQGSADLVIINTVVPVLFFYGQYHQEQPRIEQAESLLHELPAESNSITRRWTELRLPMGSAFDSQASAELYQTLCKRKACLKCAIGASLIKPDR